MAKIQTKWIADDAINENKIKLGNNTMLRGRNFADTLDLDIIGTDASDNLVLGAKLNDPNPAAPTVDTQLANKKYVDDQVAGITLPSVFELQGNYNASTNSPALANTDTGVDGYLYYVNVAGSQDFGAGSITFAVGDWVYNVNGAWEKADNNDDVVSVNGYSGVITLNSGDIAESGNLYWTQARFDTAFGLKDSDDLTEGSVNFFYTEARFNTSLSTKSTSDLAEGTNLYFTDVRVENAVLANYVIGTDTPVANTDDVKGAIGKLQAQVDAAKAANQLFEKESISLVAGDISNGYIDLGNSPVANSVRVFVVGSPEQEEGVDYTMSTNRLTFAGDLAADLVAGDKLIVSYAY